MSADRFSICVPVFNGGAFIERTIASVLAQTDPDWELLLVDDASTDDSLVRAARFDDDRITVLPADENIGLAGGSAVFLADTLSLRSNDPGRVTDRLRTTPVPLRDHYRLLARHAAAAPRALVRGQRGALRQRGVRRALHHLRHGRVRAAASFVKHVAIGERSVAAAT
jgi:glycosyltransferase involved in cell wall biosynthesis